MPEPAFPSRRELLMLAALTAGHFAWTVLCFTAADWVVGVWYPYSQFAACAYANCIGSVAAQFVLLAAWTALGPGSHLARVSGSMLLLFIVGYALALYTDGFYSGDTSYGQVTIAIIGGQIAGLVLQLPFWLFRFIWGWRVAPCEKVTMYVSEPTGRFSILHLLGGTIFVAALLAMGQVFTLSQGKDLGFVGTMAVTGAIGVAVQLVFLWTILSPERRSMFTTAAILLVVSGSATAGVFIYFGLSHLGMRGEELVYLTLSVSYCSLLVVTLLIVRGCGFRLAMASGKRRLPDSALQR